MTVQFDTIKWQDNAVIMLDQRKLPETEVYVTLTSYEEVAQAIKNMTIRGAPAIGVAAAMGVALGALKSQAQNFLEFDKEVKAICQTLFETRPTAVNLKWALDRMEKFIQNNSDKDVAELKNLVIEEAKKIRDEDIQTNRQIGQHGQKILNSGDNVLTHCNAGALATAGFGTALGVIYAAVEAGKAITVMSDETRPVLQGARLSAWELQKNNIPVTVITDSMAASFMGSGKIQKIIVGADRIAANGDTANKIGTYSVAINAKYHNIPFYVAAPFSTIDVKTKTGKDIPIEERDQNEVAEINEKRLVPKNVKIKNPAFDVTPAELITGIITEKGILNYPFEEKIKELTS